MMTWLVPFLCSFGFRVRGGLFESQWRRLPLNKYWFAAIFAACACWLNGLWALHYYLIVFIAARLSTQLAGWGEFVWCAIGMGVPDPNRSDFADADEFVDNFEVQERDIKIWKWTIHIPHFKLSDYPKLFGVVGLTIRGVFQTFIIGLALHSVSFMLCGAAMGLIYYIGGCLFRLGLDDNKNGWNTSEWLYGFYQGLCLLLTTPIKYVIM
jgi:hypothetical protein